MKDNYNKEKVPVYYTCGTIKGRYIKPIKIKQKTKPILIKRGTKWELQEKEFL